MSGSDITSMGLIQMMARFPESAPALQRMARASPEFREICEEYALAQQSLAGFEARFDADQRPEIGDYRRVIAEIEAEIAKLLRAGAPGT